MSENNLPESLLDVVSEADLPDIVTELGEVALDLSMDEGLLKDIPILGTLAKVVSVSQKIRAYFFVRKLKAFLTQLEHVPHARRVKWHEKLQSDQEFRQRVGENLLLILERLDDMGKPELLGKVFASYIEGRISYDDFARLGSAIDRLYLPDLSRIVANPNYEGNDDWAENLYVCGLMRFQGLENYAAMEAPYKVSRIGHLLLEVYRRDQMRSDVG